MTESFISELMSKLGISKGCVIFAVGVTRVYMAIVVRPLLMTPPPISFDSSICI